MLGCLIHLPTHARAWKETDAKILTTPFFIIAKFIFRKCDIWYFENVIYDICFASLGHRWHQRCVAWILIHSSFLLLFWCGKNVRLVAIISYYLEFALFFHHLQMLLQISLLTMQCDNWQERACCGNNIILLGVCVIFPPLGPMPPSGRQT